MPIIDLKLRIGGVRNTDNLSIDNGEVFVLTAVDAPPEGLEVVDAGEDPILDIIEGPQGKSATITARKVGVSEVQFQRKIRRPIPPHINPIWKRFRVRVLEVGAVTATITNMGNRKRTP